MSKFVPPFVRSSYNYDMLEASIASGLECLDVSLAVQDQRDEADINTIVRRFGLTGQLPTDVKVPQYGDFDIVSDYQSAMNVVMEANAAFAAMPAAVRARFDNEPALFLDFALDPSNTDEAKKLGLLVPDPVVTPIPEFRLSEDQIARIVPDQSFRK